MTNMARPPLSPRTEADGVQIKLFQAATPAKRFARCRSMSSSVITLARQAIRRRNPEMSDVEVGLEFIATHYGAEIASNVRRYLEKP
jgi:hypothetical protein